MTRIDTRFAETAREGRAALVTFVMGGDPDLEASLALLKALPEAGADLIELGMPFTDPMADGPAIQAAGLRALAAKTTLAKVLALVADFREADAATPLILMGYYNPIYVYGVSRFLVDAKAAGVDGLIVVDLPPEEDSELCLPALEAGIDFIRLATPTTDAQRPAGGAHPYGGLCLLRLDHRHHRRRDARLWQGSVPLSRGSSSIRHCRLRSVSASRMRERCRHRQGCRRRGRRLGAC